MCHALVEIDCEKCSFYKTIDKIKDNPFYPDSYSDKGKLNYDMKKRKIKKEEQLSWK